ncbi:MAG: hypothetical protein RDV48_15860 [Candidatus Eremiobacteraeota bacterium]|nr:hypothetical protein [Candidatus Eremiobacteraeota bacterium]
MSTELPYAIQRIMLLAAENSAFEEQLIRVRYKAVDDLGIVLSETERALLEHVTDQQLRTMVQEFRRLLEDGRWHENCRPQAPMTTLGIEASTPQRASLTRGVNADYPAQSPTRGISAHHDDLHPCCEGIGIEREPYERPFLDLLVHTPPPEPPVPVKFHFESFREGLAEARRTRTLLMVAVMEESRGTPGELPDLMEMASRQLLNPLNAGLASFLRQHEILFAVAGAAELPAHPAALRSPAVFFFSPEGGELLRNELPQSVEEIKGAINKALSMFRKEPS